jgi:hypothetical protein
MSEETLRFPLGPWVPSAKQIEFLRIPDNVFEGFYGGAAAGGKSEVLIMLPIAREFYKDPHFKGIIFRRTYPELEESIIPRCRKIYCDVFKATYNKQDHIYTFPSGAWIKVSYMNDDSDAEAHKSAEYNYIAFDELTTFTMYQYIYLTSRCRTTRGSNLPAIVRSASNPEGVGLSWVRERFVEPWLQGGRLIQDKLSRLFRIYVPARLADNPYADPDYSAKLDLLPEATRKALKDGDWWAFAGQVFTELRKIHNEGEPDNALHVIPKFNIPSWWPKLIAMDWGFFANTWVGWGAVSPDGRLYLYREFFCRGIKIADWASKVAALSAGDKNIKIVFMDPHAWDQRGEENTIAEQVERFSGFTLEKADNDRIGGKQLIHELLRWTAKEKAKVPETDYNAEKARFILNFHGRKAYNEYLDLFTEEKLEENLPKLLFFDDCTIVVDTLQKCSYPKDASKQKLEDVAEFKGDDPYDGLRYLCKGYHRLISESMETFEELQRTQKLIDELKETGDYTHFNMQMHELEWRDNQERIGNGLQRLHLRAN